MRDDSALQEKMSAIAGEKLGELRQIMDDLSAAGDSEPENRKTMSVSMDSLDMLGAAISSVIPMLRAATQNNPATGQPLCSIANACVGDTPKAAKNGIFLGGALKTADGSLKMSGDAADTTILKGIGTAGKSVGKFLAAFPECEILRSINCSGRAGTVSPIKLPSSRKMPFGALQSLEIPARLILRISCKI